MVSGPKKMTSLFPYSHVVVVYLMVVVLEKVNVGCGQQMVNENEMLYVAALESVKSVV
jgi:hypothetical protein